MLPPKAVAQLQNFYPHAAVDHRTITPKSIGARQIGHIRVFSERNAAAWPAILAVS
jgi:predicted alpha/beta hydrolase